MSKAESQSMHTTEPSESAAELCVFAGMTILILLQCAPSVLAIFSDNCQIDQIPADHRNICVGVIWLWILDRIARDHARRIKKGAA